MHTFLLELQKQTSLFLVDISDNIGPFVLFYLDYQGKHLYSIDIPKNISLYILFSLDYIKQTFLFRLIFQIILVYTYFSPRTTEADVFISVDISADFGRNAATVTLDATVGRRAATHSLSAITPTVLPTAASLTLRPLNDENFIDIVEATCHDSRWSVGQIERVTQFMQGGTQTCSVVGPVKLPV